VDAVPFNGGEVSTAELALLWSLNPAMFTDLAFTISSKDSTIVPLSIFKVNESSDGPLLSFV
jgi:hypothetical protein